MNVRRLPEILSVLVLLCMAALMVGPMREETATVDETTFMGGGFGYFKTGSCRMAEENPLLVQMIIAAPMLFYDVHISEMAQALMEGRAHWLLGLRWKGSPTQLPQLYARGVEWNRYRVAQSPYLGPVAVTDSLPSAERSVFWYRNGLGEAQEFGRILVYDQRNQADRFLFWSRFTQLLMTIATGAFLFFWARELTKNPWAGLMAAVLWAFNPIALAYGHLAITEPGLSLMLPVAVWWFTRTVQSPSLRNVFLLGVITAVAMQMKFLALIFAPIYVALLAVLWFRQKTFAPAAMWIKWLGVFVAGFWLTILVVYFPHWSPPPPIDPTQAAALNVPGWFQTLRPLLIPGEFFKAVTLKVYHSQAGQDAFLIGQWSKTGWWYYYPLAMWFKTPIPLLILTVAGGVLIARRMKDAEYAALVPWVAAAVYLLAALTSKIDIGVRHVMPIYPLLAVGVGVELIRSNRRVQLAAWILCGWLVGVAVFAYPHYIPYCNFFAGGTSDGYKYLIDSNYDWGQDGKRLKAWMEQNDVDHVLLDYFGTQPAIEWHEIPNTRIAAGERNLNGWVVVSASQLMRPDWAWLRTQHQPYTRIAYTLFVYRFPLPSD